MVTKLHRVLKSKKVLSTSPMVKFR